MASCHVHMVEDAAGDLVGIRYFCSPWCAAEGNAPEPSAWPGGMETDYPVYCETCGDLMWEGVS